MTMSAIQKQAMTILNRDNASAIKTAQGWIWKQDIRESEEAARAVLEMVR